MRRSYILAYGLVLAILMGAIAPAGAQAGQQPVHIKIYLFNKKTGSGIPSERVYFQQPRTAACPTGAAASAETGADGVADIYVTACLGSADIFMSSNEGFSGGAGRFITITRGQSAYEERLGAGPSDYDPNHTSNKYLNKPEERTLHIRVRGRQVDGALTPVHFATVYDSQGRHVATTDYNGMATVQVREAIGESVAMSADGGTQWGEARSSYIVGASEGGTRLTRADDYINFVLNGKDEQSAEQIELEILVRGKTNGKSKAVHFATVYDGEGHHIATTDYNGRATATVKAKFGEPYTIKVDGGSRWKSASQEIVAGSRKGAFSHVSFLLEPSQVATKTLTVEVLNHDDDKPIPSATVTLYKPHGFPGTAVAHAQTNSEGLATFEADEVDGALVNGTARLAAKHGNSKSSVQTLSGELLQSESPKYLLYLKESEEKTQWSGTWYSGAYTIQISGGQGSLSYTFRRNDGLDSGSAYCKVEGNTATCTETGHYRDSVLNVNRTSKTQLTYQGDTLSETGEITKATATKDGKSCKAASDCTRLSPGAPTNGTWTRKKP